MEGKTDVIERILASLPPRSREKNIKAVTKAFKGAEIDPFSYNFKRIKDSFNNEFIVMQYTEHPKREGCYRSPYTGFYEPGEVFFDNPLKDMPDYWSVEKQMNVLLPVYLKMYFRDNGLANFYSLHAEENTLMGVFVVDGWSDDAKKVKEGVWKGICAIKLTIDSDHRVTAEATHNIYFVMQNSSKYYGDMDFTYISKRKKEFKFTENLTYLAREKFKLYVKYMGKILEQMESHVLSNGMKVEYGRAEQILSKCRKLHEENDFFKQKKKAVSGLLA